MNERWGEIKKELEKYFSRTQRREIYSFLSRGFSFPGKIAIGEIFLTAAKQGKSFSDIMVACEGQYHRTWRDQTPFTQRGNLDADHNVGAENRKSVNNIYKSLGLSPFGG